MKKPNISAVAVNLINLAIRGAVRLDIPRMIHLERKHAEQLKKDAVDKAVLEELTQLYALANMREHIDAHGEYESDEAMWSAYQEELAFARIVIRNV